MKAVKQQQLRIVCVWSAIFAYSTRTFAWTASPLTRSSSSRILQHRYCIAGLSESNDSNNGGGGGLLDFLNPYETKIPEALREEIYAAEANTPAAKERGQRVALYALLAFVGILSAFFNGFFSELRSSGPEGTPDVDLVEAGFGWVLSNPIFKFLFLNKIGGGICLLGGAGAGLMAEAELDTKRINAEKIYEEMERRRAAKIKKSAAKSSSKKRRSGKESKRLVALSEVMAEESAPDENNTATFESGEASAEEIETESRQDWKESSTKEKENDGLFGSIKSLYDKADSMAASQALLLNKKLEDGGVVEKITDETGLRVIGREEAAKLAKKAEEKKDSK